MEFYCCSIELPISYKTLKTTKTRLEQISNSDIAQNMNIKKLAIEELAQQTKKNTVEHHQVSAPLFSLTGDSMRHSTPQFLSLWEIDLRQTATNTGY